MSPFPIHTVESAPAASRPLLQQVQKAFGAVPNLAGVLADSPAALESFVALNKTFDSTALDATERQVVLLATSYANECDYCMSVHTVIAGMHKVPPHVVAALREGKPLADAKLEALRTFTRAVVEKRGAVEAAEVQGFLAAGYTRAQLLDVLVGVANKTLTNYVNAIARTPLDAAFQKSAWRPLVTAAK